MDAAAVATMPVAQLLADQVRGYRWREDGNLVTLVARTIAKLSAEETRGLAAIRVALPLATQRATQLARLLTLDFKPFRLASKRMGALASYCGATSGSLLSHRRCNGFLASPPPFPTDRRFSLR